MCVDDDVDDVDYVVIYKNWMHCEIWMSYWMNCCREESDTR